MTDQYIEEIITNYSWQRCTDVRRKYILYFEVVTDEYGVIFEFSRNEETGQFQVGFGVESIGRYVPLELLQKIIKEGFDKLQREVD